MKHGTPFRAAAMFAAALAAIHARFAADFVARQGALAKLGSYEGRGKGRARHHDRGGSRAYQRAATKRRNVKRFRAQNRG